MTTARQIITKALQKNGVLVKSEQPDADEANDALDALNMMISSWSNESILIYVRSWETFNLTGGVASYTIGTGQTFNTTRPTFIIDGYIVQSSTVNSPLSIITDQQYNDIPDKTVGGVPFMVNYDNGYPTGTLRFFYVPSSAYPVFLLTEKPLTTFTLDTVISLPPGWERALVYNLAVELAPEYGVGLDAAVIKIANDSKGSIARAVMKNRTMDANPDVGLNRLGLFLGGYYM